jgi:hypothetical protein
MVDFRTGRRCRIFGNIEYIEVPAAVLELNYYDTRAIDS